jgi:predicted nucleic acid-binding protein
MVEYLIGSTRANHVRHVIRARGEVLHIPGLCDVEVASALRRLLLRRDLTQDRATQALRDYLDLPLRRSGHQHLLTRVLQLRTNFSAYDAPYVALAERVRGRLLTGDEALARAVERHLEIEAVLA